MKPQEIEDLSFKIIQEEAGDHGFDQKTWPVVRRMIHTSADFEYLTSVRFSPGSVDQGIQAIKNGSRIYTDTNMGLAGIRKKEITEFNGSVSCLIADEKVARKAKEQGTTRALAAVDMACEKDPEAVFAIGNAPTALLRLIELIRENKARPALVIGFPVGFVNAAESKAELLKVDIPYITNIGRKGGSNIVVSIVNALAIMAAQSK